MQTTHSRYRFWLMLVVIVALAAACSAQKPALPLPQGPQSLDAPAMPGIAKGMAQLLILPSPDGVQVIVDGEVRGASPLTLTLPAGEHRIALSAAGFTPFSETVTLEAGREATYAPDLEDIEPPVVKIDIDTFQVPWQGEAHVRAVASDNAGVLDIELALEDQTLAAAEGSELSLDLVPAEIPGIQPGRTYTLTAIATDAAGNNGDRIAAAHHRRQAGDHGNGDGDHQPGQAEPNARATCRRDGISEPTAILSAMPPLPAPLCLRRRPRDRFP